MYIKIVQNTKIYNCQNPFGVQLVQNVCMCIWSTRTMEYIWNMHIKYWKSTISTTDIISSAWCSDWFSSRKIVWISFENDSIIVVVLFHFLKCSPFICDWFFFYSQIFFVFNQSIAISIDLHLKYLTIFKQNKYLSKLRERCVFRSLYSWIWEVLVCDQCKTNKSIRRNSKFKLTRVKLAHIVIHDSAASMTYVIMKYTLNTFGKHSNWFPLYWNGFCYNWSKKLNKILFRKINDILLSHNG